jgi:glycosyltransferase involved in cell wall biosynthesis
MLSKNRGSDENTIVAHDGVDLSPYSMTKAEAREELGLSSDSNIVMYTGHLYPRKGVRFLVEAAANINAEVMIVGGYEEDIERIKAETNPNKNTSFIGFVEPSEIHKYQISSDVLVAPYTEDAWMPSPLKLFEYMAANSPIVASRLPTIEEVLNDRQNALLVPTNNSNFLAESINKLLSNEELSDKLQMNAREDVQMYTWSKRAENILEFADGLK